MRSALIQVPPPVGSTTLLDAKPKIERDIFNLGQKLSGPTCRGWCPAGSSAPPCAAPARPGGGRSRAPGARPPCSPDTWPSRTTRSRTPSPAGGDRVTVNKEQQTTTEVFFWKKLFYRNIENYINKERGRQLEAKYGGGLTELTQCKDLSR